MLYQSEPGFNSKLVRLKELHVLQLTRSRYRFNSKLVRLKVSSASMASAIARMSFNSKLVRLKV